MAVGVSGLKYYHQTLAGVTSNMVIPKQHFYIKRESYLLCFISTYRVK